MGASLSCCSNGNSASKREVILVRENGELIRFSEGARVKDVISDYPDHEVIPCRSSDRWALPDSCQLSCNRLYMLLPEGLTLSDAMYESLVRGVVAKVGDKGGDRKMSPGFDGVVGGGGGGGDGVVVVGQVLGVDDFGYKMSPWRPSLYTIPEGISPPRHANVCN